MTDAERLKKDLELSLADKFIGQPNNEEQLVALEHHIKDYFNKLVEENLIIVDEKRAFIYVSSIGELELIGPGLDVGKVYRVFLNNEEVGRIVNNGFTQKEDRAYSNVIFTPLDNQ